MSSPKYASPLRFNIIPSRILLILIGGLHAGAVLLLIPLTLPVVAKLLFAAIIAVGLFVFLSQSAWLSSNISLLDCWPTFVDAVWDENDQWLLRDKRHQTHRAQLLPTSYVHARLVVINLRLQDMAWYNRYRTIILLHDNIDSETFRRLRVRLRWYASQVPGSSVEPG